jgi:hypothetical protein
MPYRSCPSCARYVRRTDSVCPFCGSAESVTRVRPVPCVARLAGDIRPGQWLAFGAALVASGVSGACKSAVNADDVRPLESGAPLDADRTEAVGASEDVDSAGVDSTLADAAPADAVSDASVAAQTGAWLTSGDGTLSCGPLTCDRAHEWCYVSTGDCPNYCVPFATNQASSDACSVSGPFFWDASACDGGLRRCACINVTCIGYAPQCVDDEAGGITVACGVCYGAPPALGARGPLA